MIKASVHSSVFDFKRLILSTTEKPFFLSEDVPNDMTLNQYFKNTNTIQISFDINTWTRQMQGFNTNDSVSCKFSMYKTIEEIIDDIK